VDIADSPSFAWIGYADRGVIDRIDSEGVTTEFFNVVIPVWPQKTYYVYVNRDGDVCRFAIPRDRRSVFLGFARTPLWTAALVCAAPGFVDFARWKYLLAIGIGLAIAAAVLTFVVGKLTPGERDRRALLRRVVGLGAPPELIPEAMLEQMRDDLADEWFHQAQMDWRDSIHRGEASETLVVLAEYHRDARLAIRARTNLIALEGN